MEPRTVVEELIARGVRFEEVEAFIDRLRLSDEEKSALWLLAWTESEPALRRGRSGAYVRAV